MLVCTYTIYIEKYTAIGSRKISRNSYFTNSSEETTSDGFKDNNTKFTYLYVALYLFYSSLNFTRKKLFFFKRDINF